MIIVLYVIFMIAGRYKNRIEIYHIYSKLFQIVQFVDNALYISAVKVCYISVFRHGIPIGYFFCTNVKILVFAVLNVITYVPVKESVCEYLIAYGFFCPFRRFIFTVYHKISVSIKIF